MRTKEIEFGCYKWKIRALSIDDAEKMIADLAAIGDDQQKLIRFWRELVCVAVVTEDGAEKLTPERIGRELDLPSFDFLRTSVLEFSGLSLRETER